MININKRGKGSVKLVVLSFVALVIIVFLMAILVNTGLWNSIASGLSVDIDDTGKSFGETIGPSWAWLDFIFGKTPAFLDAISSSPMSPVIITLSIWLLLFVTFSDIIDVFGTFSEKWVAWLVGFLISVVAANLKAVIYVTAFFVGILSFLGSLAVVVGIGAAFFAFIVVNLGLRRFAPWLMRRKAFATAEEAAVKTEAGGKELAGTIKGLKEVGDALKG